MSRILGGPQAQGVIGSHIKLAKDPQSDGAEGEPVRASEFC